MASERNNFKAGLFVLTALVLAFIMIVMLADLGSLFTPMQTVEARFTLSDGLKGLKTGAAVTVGGVPVGHVLSIDDQLNANGVAIADVVRFDIPAKYKIFENAQLELVVPPLGSNTKLNIRGFGGPIETAKPHGKSWAYEYGIDPPIPGNLAASEFAKGFTEQMGIGDEQRLRIKNIIANVDKTIAAVTDKRESLAETIVNLRDITAQLKHDLPQITQRTQSALDKADAAIADAKAMLEENRPTLKAAVTQARDALTDMRGVIADNRENLKDTVANAKDITVTVKDQTIAKVHKALDTANEAIVNIKQTTQDLKTLVASQRPTLEHAIANTRIVSDQLKLAAIEIRRAPWRLLYKPTDEELATDNLYDAARSFATAAASLNDTADALQAVLDRYGDQLKPDDPNLKRILDNLHQTFERFGTVQNKFWNAVSDKPAPAKPTTSEPAPAPTANK